MCSENVTGAAFVPLDSRRPQSSPPRAGMTGFVENDVEVG